MRASLTLLFVLTGTCLIAGNLRGTVVDDNNDPLPGATVLVVGTTKGVTTNSEGFYELKKLKAGTYVVEVSMVGFETLRKEVSITQTETKIIDFSLKTGTAELDEVMVIAESEAKR